MKKIIPLFLTLCSSLFADAKLVVIRHGEGDHNLQFVISSWTQEEGGVDHSLTEKGRRQVAETAQKLLEQGINKENVGLVLVSPMPERAKRPKSSPTGVFAMRAGSTSKRESARLSLKNGKGNMSEKSTQLSLILKTGWPKYKLLPIMEANPPHRSKIGSELFLLSSLPGIQQMATFSS